MMEAGTLIAGASAAIAIVAAAISWTSSRHAKRNADKALGDLPPFIEVFQLENSMFDDSIPTIAVQITNYNRRAILLEQLDIEVDERFIAFRAPRDDEEDDRQKDLALSGIVAAYMDPEYSHFSYDPPLRLPGNRSLGALPPRYDFHFRMMARNDKGAEVWPAPAHANIRFSIAGAKNSEVRLTVDLQVNCWPIERSRTAFRTLPLSKPDLNG